jgi:hypothetical protein
MTNYEAIKAMSIEDMRDAIYRYSGVCDLCPAYRVCEDNSSCQTEIMKWLESEAEE